MGQQQRNTNSRHCYIHLKSCPAKNKSCSKYAKRGHFAKVCHSTNLNFLGNPNDEQQEEVETASTETDNDPIALAEFTTKNKEQRMVGKTIKQTNFR